MAEPDLTLKDVADALGVPAHRIVAAEKAGKIPVPRRRGTTRIYSPEETLPILEYFRQARKQTAPKEPTTPDEALRLLGEKARAKASRRQPPGLYRQLVSSLERLEKAAERFERLEEVLGRSATLGK